MQNKSSIEQALAGLKPAAERTILKDLKFSPQLEERILETMRSEADTARKPMYRWRYLWIIVAFFVGMATTCAALGFLHPAKTAGRTIAAIEVSVITTAPAAALSGLLIKDGFHMGDFRPRALPSPLSVT